MARVNGIVGFETGVEGPWWSNANCSLVSGGARSGLYYARCGPGAGFGNFSIETGNNAAAFPQIDIGEKGDLRAWFYFRCAAAPGTNDQDIAGIFGGNSQHISLELQMNTSRQTRIVVSGVGSTSYGSALALDTWYKVRFRVWGTVQASGFCDIKHDVDIYAEDGTLIFSATLTRTSFSGDIWLTQSSLLQFGPTAFGAPARDFHYDDVFWDFAIKTDADFAREWPRATHVYAFPVTGQGALDQFTTAGDFAAVAEIPWIQSGGGDLSVQTSTLNNATTYRKAPLATPTDEVEYVRAYLYWFGSGSTQTVLWNGEANSKITGNGAGVANNFEVKRSYLNAPLAGPAFDAAQFGVQKTSAGGATLFLGAIVLEVLAGPPAVLPEVEFPSGGQGEIGGIFWAEFTDRAGGLHTWTHKSRELPDPAAYYGGFKEGRVVKALPIRRALSDRSGQYEGLTFGVRLSDEDRAIRAMLSTTATKTFVNCTLVERMISDRDRRAQLTPRTVGRGLVRNYSTDSPLFVELHGEDTLAVRFASQSLRDQIPNRVVTVQDFPNAAGSVTAANDAATKTPVDAVGKPVPIVYGALSDRNLATIYTPVGGSGGAGDQSLQVDGSIDQIQGAGMNGYGSAPGTFLKDERIHATVTVIKAGKESFHSTYFGNTNAGYADGSGTHGSFGISWNRVDSADGYRVYAFPGYVPGGFDPANPRNDAPGKIRFIFHDNNPATFDGLYGFHYGVILSGWDDPDWTDFFSTSPAVPPVQVASIVDTGKGACPFVYCGLETVGGVAYHVFLLAGHALKEVEEIYVNGVREDIQTARGPWLVPGYDGRPLFETRNGSRYAIVYGKAGFKGPDTGAGVLAATAETVGLTFNVKGIEDVGDGSGALITSALQQYKHAFINWILQTYETGAWLTTPAFTDDPDLPQVDEDSYDTADALALTRIPGGYVGAFAIGANNERISARDLIARFNQSCDVDAGFNRKCQWIVSMIDERPAALTVGDPIFDTVDIDAETFDSQDEIDQLFNHLPFKWAQDYTGVSGVGLSSFAGTDELINQGAEDEVREEKLAPEVDFYMLRNPGIARDVAERRLARVVEPPRLVKFTVPLIGLNSELGDVILLTHFSGIGPNGWISHPIRIVRMETDPDSLSVYIEGYDLQRFVDFLTEKGTGKYGDNLSSFGLADKAARMVPILARARIRQRPILRAGASASNARINLGPTPEEP